MESRKITFGGKNGLHARPISSLVALVKSLDSQIMISTSKKQVKASSAFALLSLGITCGTELEIVATGGEESQNADKVVEFFNSITE
ncbi:MAG: HPr family phosphocarrier protein [Alistipes sp.]|nr:HPr family phosphocarrier protein [Candidatus Alistipes equi]